MANTNEIVTSGQRTDIIHCLTIPLHDEIVLLPNASFAEVITYKEPVPDNEAPDWFLGHIEWREKRVPIISFEAISGNKLEPPKKHSRIAVLNTLNGNAQLPYVGILSQGIPSLAIVQEEGLEDKSTTKQMRPLVAAFVKFGGLEALIPNIDEIEQHLIRLNLM